ncbi:diguanylate cyclase [Gilvimarinus sp. SDUM040013]|uniref:diguanylate cyclase n=1 Tax=Gilvimarinus gilvus TaxID=3058038 RepID=A0ABU4S120_9GAMM|nr:diguanylate cyclase [Gilvimarinus sp. SDUM040013]MDO3384821.1 diguanylate cyclase [Gilvimarinus sp. SDUM040013]MDX6850846.1 diguanylate cyclase [Gilvimarinus sp. SDUM040013]
MARKSSNIGAYKPTHNNHAPMTCLRRKVSPKPLNILMVLCFLSIVSGIAGQAQCAPVSLAELPPQPLGRYLFTLQESGDTSALNWHQAYQRFLDGEFVASDTSVIAKGLAAQPIWLALELKAASSDRRRLMIDASWIDQLDFFHLSHGQLIYTHTAGDHKPYANRGHQYTGFEVDLSFSPGRHVLLIRAQTPDPMFLPVYLLTQSERDKFATQRLFTYGLGYGYLLALMLYNVLLFLGLKDRRHLLYAFYLGVFVTANLGYTGHGFAWIWPDATAWQRWGQPILLGLFGTSALVFSVEFLDIRKHWRRGFYWALGATCLFWLTQVIALVQEHHTLAITSAFVFLVVYTVLMLIHGFHQLSNQPLNARYFLIAISAGTLGTITTTLTAIGLLPAYEFTFRAAEIGMLIEATLLALALAARFRLTQQAHDRAQYNANIDVLTGLNNRRALKELLDRLWAGHQRHGHPLSIVIMDIDHFKEVNDIYGHIGGDQVLRKMGQLIKESVRAEDVAARWGGEEFLIAMPHSTASGAIEFAERLREKIERVAVRSDTGDTDETISVTASFGIAQCTLQETTLEQPIVRADKALYQAKINGRNRSLIWNAHMKNRNRVTNKASALSAQ